MWCSSELNSPIPIHFSSLIPKRSLFTLGISCLTTSNLPRFMDLTFQVPMQYCSLCHRTFTTRHIHSWASFPLWFSLFIPSGVISLLFSSTLGTYRPQGFAFQCHIFIPSHTVHGVLNARMLKWFAIPFSKPGTSYFVSVSACWWWYLQALAWTVLFVGAHKISQKLRYFSS